MVTDQDLLRKIYAAFNTRDIETVLALMHPEIVWPNGWEGGWVSGHQGIRDYWTRQWAAIDPYVEPVAFNLDETGHIAVKVHQIVRDRAGQILADGWVEHVYLIEDGLIKSMEIRKG